MKVERIRFRGMLLVAFFYLVAGGCAGHALAAELPDYTSLSLEELMEIEITSVAKMPQHLSQAAAAIFVITAEDIRRSGATSLPEALRLAPGLQVARLDSNKWEITARGFNGINANKLLVLIDGRSVYSPYYAGVTWEVQDLLLENIERIEVIRGPGAALWGANAVNGVINILTRNARDTQGGLLVAGGGTEELGFGKLRYGGPLGENGHYRVWGQYANRDDSVQVGDGDAADQWQDARGGFRIDWRGKRDLLTLQGDAYYNKTGNTLSEPLLTSPYNRVTDFKAVSKAGNILGRWSREFSEKSTLKLQIYYDHSDRDRGYYREIRDTADLDLQYRFPLLERHDLLLGFGYRLTHDDFSNAFVITTDPDSQTDQLFSAFVQDTVTLIRDELSLTLGARFEHNDYSGFEVQPSLRLAWTPAQEFTLWGAASRAVRTPSRAEHDTRNNLLVMDGGGMPTVLAILPNEDLDSEKLYAFEVGFRVRPLPEVFVDVAAFYHIYEDLMVLVPGSPFVESFPEPAHQVAPQTRSNEGSGMTYGVELALDWRPWNGWQLKAAYTLLRIDLDTDRGSWDSDEGDNPRHQISIQSRLDLGEKATFDLWLRYVDNLPDLGIHSYFGLDARLGYRVTKNLELAVVGQNLLDGRHPEFATYFFAPNELERGVYGKLTWKF